MLLRIKASNFAAFAFVAGQFMHFRHAVDTRMSFCLAVVKAHSFFPKTDNWRSQAILSSPFATCEPKEAGYRQFQSAKRASGITVVLIFAVQCKWKGRVVVSLPCMSERSSSSGYQNSPRVSSLPAERNCFYFCKWINFHGSIGNITSGGGVLGKAEKEHGAGLGSKMCDLGMSQ